MEAFYAVAAVATMVFFFAMRDYFYNRAKETARLQNARDIARKKEEAELRAKEAELELSKARQAYSEARARLHELVNRTKR